MFKQFLLMLSLFLSTLPIGVSASHLTEINESSCMGQAFDTKHSIMMAKFNEVDRDIVKQAITAAQTENNKRYSMDFDVLLWSRLTDAVYDGKPNTHIMAELLKDCIRIKGDKDHQ